MSRKVFISFLGTGNYVNCKYQFDDGDVSMPVRFIQEALISKICHDWGESHRIFIFCTDEAVRKNWNNNGHVDLNNPNQHLEDIEREGLESRLRNTRYWPLVSMHRIKEGFSEDEVWEIFDEVYRHLAEGDELFFDVTHAFRSIPMFTTILFNYASFMKGIEVNSIHYGAFEKLGAAYKVKKEMPLELRIAPILNLTNLIRLQQYTDIASSFTTFGRVKKLSDALREEVSETNSVVKEVYKALEDFDNALSSNRISEIEQGKYMLVINNSVKPLRKQHISTPVKEILNRLRCELTQFGFVPTKSAENIEAAISWAKHYKMLPQAYTMGQEYIITLVADRFSACSPFRNDRTGKKDFRLFVSSICSINDDDVAKKNYRDSLKKHVETTELLLQNPIINELRPYYSKLGEKRNAVNHGKGEVSYVVLVEEFDKLFSNCLKIVKRDSYASIVSENKSLLLINLSNHPYEQWGDRQREAAREYGEVVDMPFPLVDEQGDEAYIETLVDEYLIRVMSYAERHSVTVHLMGELTFCYALLDRLRQQGIPIIASTSKRMVSDDIDGNKVVTFQFARFRNYC